jgi:hypothetical protein
MVAWQEYAEENPVAARSISALVNIGLLAGPVKVKPRVPVNAPTRETVLAGRLASTGRRLEESATKAVKQNKQNLAEDLVTPAQTKKVRTDQTTRTTEKGGLLNQKVVGLSDDQAKAAAELVKLPISRKNTLQGNLNIIRQANRAEAESLKKKLASLHVRGRYKSSEFFAEMDAAFARMKRTGSGLVGDPKKSVKEAMARMEVLAAEQPSTLAGLLQARKNFDTEIIRQRKNFFETETSNALQLAVDEIRQTTNNFIAARARQKGVRESLNKQFRLFQTEKTLGVRAGEEGSNRLVRGFRNALKLLPFRGEFNQFMAAVFGIGGLGASAKFAPWFTKLVGLTGVTYVAGKAVLRPEARKGLAGLLNMTDRAIQRTTDPALLLQMRADRAAIVELLKITKEDE